MRLCWRSLWWLGSLSGIDVTMNQCSIELVILELAMKLFRASMSLSILAVAISACATKSSEIAPTYVSPVQYQNYDCQQLGVEAQSVSQQAAIASGQQDKIRQDDTIKTTVGAVIFWPVLLFNSGDGNQASQVASLKGQMQAIQSASVQKKCGFQFKQ